MSEAGGTASSFARSATHVDNSTIELRDIVVPVVIGKLLLFGFRSPRAPLPRCGAVISPSARSRDEDQFRGVVPFHPVGKDGDDVRTFAELLGGSHGSRVVEPGARPHGKAAPDERTGSLDRIVIRDVDDFDNALEMGAAEQFRCAVDHARHAPAEAAVLEVFKPAAVLGTRGEWRHRAARVLECLVEAEQRSAGSQARDDTVDRAAFHLGKDFLARPHPMGLRVVGVFELASRIRAARGTNSTEPPYARMVSTLSWLTPSGMTAVNRRSICAQASASAMLVD